EAEEAAFKDVAAFAVDLVDPPGEVDEQFVETALEELAIAAARALLLHAVDAPDSPGVYRRIQVRKLPPVCGDLSIGMLELLEQQDPELVLGVARIDGGERDAMKRQVPRSEPRVLPLVRHRHDAHRVQVVPVDVAKVIARLRRRRLGEISLEPL